MRSVNAQAIIIADKSLSKEEINHRGPMFRI
jgi:hypothetical protein